MFFQRSRFMFMIAFLLVALISAGGQSIVAHAATTGGPTIALSSQTVSPGQTLTATGQGLTPQASFQLLLEDTQGNGQRELSSIWSDSNGNFTDTFIFPQDDQILQGNYIVTLYPGNSSAGQSIAQIAVNVIPALFQVTGSSGFPVTIIGASFTAYEAVEVYFGTNVNGKDQGKATSDSGGKLSFSFTMPSGLTAGDYSVTVVRSAQTPLIITGTIHLYPLTLSMISEGSGTQAFTALGTGFVPNEYVTLTWNANGGQDLLDSQEVDNNGAFEFTVWMPAAPKGNYTIIAKGSTSGFAARTGIRIRPVITLSAVNGGSVGQSNPGGQISVIGGGFNANEQVNVYFQTKKNGVTTVTTDSTGSIDTTITVPMHYSSGTTYYVYAKNVTGTAYARAKFTYIPPSVLFSDRFSADPSAGTLYIGGFGANEKIQIVDRYQQSNQVIMQTLTADASGSAIAKITWPSSAHTDQMPFAAIGETTHLVARGTHPVDPTLLTTTTDEIDAVGNAGDTVLFNGKDFAAVEKVTIAFNGKVISTTTSRKDGSFVASVVIPPLENVSSGAGDVQVEAVGVTSGLVAGLNPYHVTFYYQPTLTITPISGPSGTTITVTGTHFPAGATIPIGWDGPFSPDPDLSEYPAGTYAVTNADQNGSFTATVQANDLVSGQTYHVTASNFPGGPTLLTTATFVAQ